MIGVIIATVDIANGLKPYDEKVYYARTLDGKRFFYFIREMGV